MHGNLDSVRTLIDVRDAMESYWLAAVHCEPGEAYNIGGTTTISVGEFLDATDRARARPDPGRARIRRSCGRPTSRSRSRTPANSRGDGLAADAYDASFEESVGRLLDHWRSAPR